MSTSGRLILNWDDREWQKLLKVWEPAEVRHTLELAADSYGKAATPIVKAATPVAPPGNRIAGTAGNLRRLTRWARIRPSYGIGVIIAPMGKGAFYRGWVSYGTKPHSLARRGSAAYRAGRGILHPGSKPNDYVGRVATRADDAGYKAADELIGQALDGQRVT